MITTEKFKLQMNMKNPNIEILSEYQGDKIYVDCKCKICGNEWKDTPTHLKQGRGCSICKKNQKRQESQEDFIKRSQEIHNNKYDYSKVKYINQQSYVTIICQEHGEFEQIPNSHLRGRGCPKCANKNRNINNRKTTEQFVKEAILIHGNKYNYDKVNYIEAHTPVIITCPIHGDFEQTPNKHLSRQHGCPKCQLKSQTKLYEKLKESFPNEEILFEVNKTIIPWIENQRIDIYFPKHNIAIEYNGEQHYIQKECFGGEIGFNDTKERDTLKRLKCKENNCTLFEVKYNYTEDDYKKLVQKIQNLI